MIFFQFFITYSIYHPPSADTSFKFLALRLFKIPWIQYLQNKPSVCQRAAILQGEIIQGKPKIRFSYFSMRNPYMKFQHHISMPHTYIHTDIQTSRNQYVPTFSKFGAYKEVYTALWVFSRSRTYKQYGGFTQHPIPLCF